jgi:heme exporter protein A
VSKFLLELNDLSCEREGRRLFSDLKLTVSSGECVELTGPNGSGKSTLLRCICGLFPDFTGTVEAGSLEYLGHRAGITGLLSPLENLRWYQSMASTEDDLLNLLDRVGLRGYEESLCSQLSAGQQRRVAMARLIIGRRPLWLLDEPFTALDADGQELVRSLLRSHSQEGGAAICATHQPLELEGVTELRLGQPS